MGLNPDRNTRPGHALPANSLNGVCPQVRSILGNCPSGMATDPVNVSEFRELARRTLPKMYFDFVDGGAEDEVTLRENIEAFKRITFRPRVLIDVSNINMSTCVLGHRVSAPIMLAPSAMHQWAHPQGELATARAAASRSVIMVVSTFSSISHEEIAAVCNGTLFLQLYVFKNREITRALVQRAEKCGYKALVLTADVPKLGKREADIRNGMVPTAPEHFRSLLTGDVVNASGSKAESFASHVLDDSLCWKDVEWLRSITKMPVCIKGLLTAEDATKALEVGVDGIIVSNHGGRQLDYAPSAISALEEVVQAVAGKVPVLLDGGIRRGTDVFKALALGAQAILIGRPVVFGLAAQGEKGVRKVIELLTSELEITMALNGCCSVEAITRAHVQTHRDKLRSML